ncbi:Zinc/iron permease [Xylona heveae TC161]|uniref:Zinc/iron permease n=1 Tax=Xylona heveae (strain CBS 132557 / TC161) TaxID=1328760 RepID=A0A165JCQ3_XYLHT|nr:Zinc/iron permease [Xylona heveae TC161]KZF26060.1 Zinc/iron permease [Xylona heveae TC161]
MHVVALVIILVLSTGACSFPLIVRHFPQLHVPRRFLFLSRHFGTGVLIATAFVHLLPTAFQSMTDPCLPKFWNEGYPAMPGFIAMISVLLVVGIEMFFATRGAGHVHGDEYDSLPPGQTREELAYKLSNGISTPTEYHHANINVYREADLENGEPGEAVVLEDMSSSSPPRSQPKPAKHRKSSSSGGQYYTDDPEDDGNDEEDGEDGEDSDLDIRELDPLAGETGHTGHQGLGRGNGGQLNYSNYGQDDGQFYNNRSGPEVAHGHGHSAEEQEERKMLLQCLLLEAGILFHSVFIGMALSVATGTPFIVLLIAISFHQTFEGLALGSRIAAVKALSLRSPKPWLMALAYGTTTPIGQAIGLVVHNLYDPASQTGLLMVGIMNAISSGLLLFAGLVELLAEDFLSDKSYTTLQGRRRLEACGSVVGGAILMALVGAWA